MEGTWNVPTEKVLDPDQMARVMDVASRHPAIYKLAIMIGANVGLRICEVMHIKAEDVLGGNKLRVTRRKKRVLKSEVIEVNDDIAAILRRCAEEVKTGWLFSGGAKPCKIKRAPAFLEDRCPECKKQIIDRKRTKKKSEQLSAFSMHLINEHGWETERIDAWITKVSKTVIDPVPGCTGGHLHLRTVQMRWRLILAEAGYAMRGRGFHTTRHYAITQYVDQYEGNIVEAQQFAGHSSPSMTAKYCHPKKLGERVRKMKATV
jgi:integrase